MYAEILIFMRWSLRDRFFIILFYSRISFFLFIRRGVFPGRDVDPAYFKLFRHCRRSHSSGFGAS